MISFKDLVRKGAVKAKEVDDTKRLSIKDVLDKPIIIRKYENNVNTKYGSSKLVIYFTFDGSDTMYKIFTGSQILADLITQIPEDALTEGVLTTIIKSRSKDYEFYKLT